VVEGEREVTVFILFFIIILKSGLLSFVSLGSRLVLLSILSFKCNLLKTAKKPRNTKPLRRLSIRTLSLSPLL
jgi:hypothetical protein